MNVSLASDKVTWYMECGLCAVVKRTQLS